MQLGAIPVPGCSARNGGEGGGESIDVFGDITNEGGFNLCFFDDIDNTPTVQEHPKSLVEIQEAHRAEIAQMKVQQEEFAKRSRQTEQMLRVLSKNQKTQFVDANNAKKASAIADAASASNKTKVACLP